jgi:hypothetical protein
MVKVIYNPPPKGPMTHLGMPGYGPRLGQETKFTLWLAKQRQGPLIAGAVVLGCAFCALPQLVREAQHFVASTLAAPLE